jgi:hypothetical protein
MKAPIEIKHAQRGRAGEPGAAAIRELFQV